MTPIDEEELERISSLFPVYGSEGGQVGHILVKEYLDHGVFSTQLAKSFAVSMVNGGKIVTSVILMDSIMENT